jgi:DNA-binding NarL/FixJ family response regulator
MKSIYKILILDDHTLILNGFKSILSGFPNFQVYDFSNFKKISDYIDNNSADLLITDLHMPEISGQEVIKWIKSKDPLIKTILYTQTVNQRIFEECQALDVDGYLLKTETIEDLTTIILQILEGKKVFSSEVLKFKKKENALPKIKVLERKILQLITNGKSMKEVSEVINISEKVVEYRMRKLRKQFDCKNNVELIYKVKEMYI